MWCIQGTRSNGRRKWLVVIVTNYQSRLDAVDRTIETLTNQAVDDISSQRSPAAQRRIIEKLVHEARALERDNVLMTLMTANEVAEHFNVTPRRIRAKADWLRERGHNAGMKVGNAWIFDPRELPNLEPLPPHRPTENEQ